METVLLISISGNFPLERLAYEDFVLAAESTYSLVWNQVSSFLWLFNLRSNVASAFWTYQILYNMHSIRSIMYSVLQQKSNKILKVLLVFQLMNLVVEITWLQCNFWPPVSMGFIFSSDSHLPKKCFFTQWKPFKVNEKCFLFYFKSSFCSQDNFCLDFLVM